MWLQSWANTFSAVAALDRNDKEVIFENCVLFPDCMSRINNTQAKKYKRY